MAEEDIVFQEESALQISAADRWLMSASEIYDEVDFRTDDIYNKPAPDPYYAFAIGAALSVLGFIMWLRRLRALKRTLSKDEKWKGTVWIRAMISVAIDSDEPFYTIVSYAAPSFLFLGGLQLDYTITFAVMLGTYNVTTILEPIRILLAWRESNSLADITFASAQTRVDAKTISTLNPTNIYEDLGRGGTIVAMVFLTQCILISFVIIDVFRSDTHSCMDGTPGCPVVGTLGSWGQYVLGIFMANVFLLGPKTNFGQSEQNPSYWLHVLLSAKQAGSQVSWYDPIYDETRTRQLSTNDWRIWARLAMSTLINGVGFHVLVHALPIQIAAQSSLLGVVFRAVGMMYLVDLDDTAGHELSVEENLQQEEEGADPSSEQKADDGLMKTIQEGRPLHGSNRKNGGGDLEEQPQPLTTTAPPSSTTVLMTGVGASVGGGGGNYGSDPLGTTATTSAPALSEEEVALEVQRILSDARAQIDALAGGVVGTSVPYMRSGSGGSFTSSSGNYLRRRRRNPADVHGNSRRRSSAGASISSQMLVMCGSSSKSAKYFRTTSSGVSASSAAAGNQEGVVPTTADEDAGDEMDTSKGGAENAPSGSTTPKLV